MLNSLRWSVALRANKKNTKKCQLCFELFVKKYLLVVVLLGVALRANKKNTKKCQLCFELFVKKGMLVVE